MNVFNQVLPSMNPQELSTMVWMGQFASPLDENLANIYGQPVPAVMDDISQPSPSLDMNPAIGSLIGDYSGHVTAIPTPTGGLATIPNPDLAITNPELFNLQQQQLQLQQQLNLGNYSFLEQSGLAGQMVIVIIVIDHSGTPGGIIAIGANHVP